MRTRIQHAWATAGEITELFSGYKIKNLYGDEKWKDFYKLAADCMALIDDRYITRDLTAENINFEQATRLLREKHGPELKPIAKGIKKGARDLKVHEKFNVFRSSLKATDLRSGGNKFCVIHATGLENGQPSVDVLMFSSETDARSKNFEIEKGITSDANELVVMLSVNKMANIEDSFPNYFADSAYFLNWLKVIENI